MSLQALDLMKSGIIQSGGAVAFTDQAVVANGSQYLSWNGGTSGVISADNAECVIFCSGTPDDTTNPNFIGYGSLAFANLVRAEPALWQISHDAGSKNHGPTVSPAAATRQHVLLTCKASGSDLIIQSAYWDATNGLQTKQETLTGASTVEFNTSGGVVTLLAQPGGGGRLYEGDINRLAMWVGATGDATSTAFSDLFFDGATMTDPATSRASIGTPIFDAYGNAATWNSGSFPVGSFTKSGDAFTDA